jgi:hypothetical protein
VRFPLAILRHAIILWLAMKNSLSTGDWLLQLGYKGDTLCTFCRGVLKIGIISFSSAASAREFGEKS